MRSEPIIFLSIVVIVLLLVDLYAFKGIKTAFKNVSSLNIKTAIHVLYWLFSVMIYAGFIFMMFNIDQRPSAKGYAVFSLFMGLAILSIVPKLVFSIFHLLEDIGFFTYKLVKSSSSQERGEPISRFTFLTRLGLIIAAIPFVSIIYGMVKGKYDFKVIRKKLYFDNLPDSFEGLKVVQFSDAHLGSFNGNKKEVNRGLEMINALEPDVILFTGDIVNNFAEETQGWQESFSNLKAKYGKFSILGNHDYGDYSEWESIEAKQKNLEGVMKFHEDVGFRLLLDENIELVKNQERIRIIGVQNWGKGFAQYGNLKKAIQHTHEEEFQILLSHDPTHWDEEVIPNSKIDLTLSGHTHGMQFGVNLGKFKYSPAQHRYKRWSGLYKKGKQFLYVNKGFGFIAFPGRVGMPPEITLLELYPKT